MYDLKHFWNFCWKYQRNTLLSFDLTSKCKDLTFFCKNCIVKYDLKHCWKIITPLCMSIARSLGKILFGFEHGKHDLFKASQGHHHFTQFWNLKFNYQKEKRVYLCYLFSYFVDVHICDSKEFCEVERTSVTSERRSKRPKILSGICQTTLGKKMKNWAMFVSTCESAEQN